MQNSSLNENNDQNNQQVAGFVTKTFQILNMNDYSKIIYWSSNGTQFTIKDVMKFQEIVLPRYFRHNKMNSFVRQLNMYGFHKTKHNNFKSTFKHPFFQKNKQDLLPLVKRKLKNNQQIESKQQIKPQTKQPILIFNKLNTVEKQPQATSVSLEKYFNFSNQFIGTTKMINFSLKKVSFNDFNNFTIPEQNKKQDMVSIEDEIQQQCRYQDQNFLNIHNVSWFLMPNNL